MNEQTLGAIERLDAREVWTSEPYEFTPWLRENINLLGEALGLEIDVDVQREVAAGLFSADLLGTDVATSAGILIENQLEQTDHNHLGQLLTYAGWLGTDILVWVSTKVREEHRQALTWLNERTHEDVLFFAVEVEVLKIDGSRPAPNFKVVVAPNDWQKRGAARSAASSAPTERGERYRAFWRQLLERILAVDPAATTASPDRVPAQNWYGISVGRTGFQDNLVFGWNYEERVYELRAEIYIDTPDKEQNKTIFDQLASERVAIEAAFGEALLWSRRDDIRASRIYIARPGSVDEPEERLDEYAAWGADRMLALRRTFGPRIKSLQLPLPVIEVGSPASQPDLIDQSAPRT